MENWLDDMEYTYEFTVKLPRFVSNHNMKLIKLDNIPFFIDFSLQIDNNLSVMLFEIINGGETQIQNENNVNIACIKA